MSSLKIATEQKAYEVGGKGTPVTNKMVTKVRAEALGCTVSISATGNQLVPESGLAKARTSLGELIIGSGSLSINREGGTWNYKFNWSFPLPESMIFRLTYTNNASGESYTKNTSRISIGATSANENMTDKLSMIEGSFIGTLTLVRPINSNYYFE